MLEPVGDPLQLLGRIATDRSLLPDLVQDLLAINVVDDPCVVAAQFSRSELGAGLQRDKIEFDFSRLALSEITRQLPTT